MIKNIIFDLGCVILNYDLNKVYKSLELNDDEIKFLEENVSHMEEWNLLDAGIKSVDEIIDIVNNKTNYKYDYLVDNFMHNWYKNRELNEISKIIPIIKNNGYNIYILSNISIDVWNNYKDNDIFKYIDGIGTEKDVAKGIKVWERAVELGSAAAANNLFCYYYAIDYGGKKKDLEKAKDYLFKAAKLKDDQACFNLAYFYFFGGDIVKKDNKQAFIYAKMAADQNHPDACNLVAYMYENGIGCDKDPKKAQEYRDKVNPQEKKEK